MTLSLSRYCCVTYESAGESSQATSHREQHFALRCTVAHASQVVSTRIYRCAGCQHVWQTRPHTPCLMRALRSWMVCINDSFSLVRLWFCSCTCFSLELCRSAARCAEHAREQAVPRWKQTAAEGMSSCTGQAVCARMLFHAGGCAGKTISNNSEASCFVACCTQIAPPAPTIISLRWWVACWSWSQLSACSAREPGVGVSTACRARVLMLHWLRACAAQLALKRVALITRALRSGLMGAEKQLLVPLLAALLEPAPAVFLRSSRPDVSEEPMPPPAIILPPIMAPPAPAPAWLTSSFPGAAAENLCWCCSVCCMIDRY